MSWLSRLVRKPFQYRLLKREGGETLRRSDLYPLWSENDYNPDALRHDLGRRMEIYDRMFLDDKISGIMALRKSLVLSADWEVKGPHAAFVKDVLEKLYPISFVDFVHNLMDAAQYGFKVAEAKWTFRDGMQVYETIKCKRSHNIHFVKDQFDNLKYFYIGDSDTGADRHDPLANPGKYIVYVHPYVNDGNWYGTSDLQGVYREWWAKDKIVKARGVYLEQFGMPLLHLLYDEEMPSDMRDDLFRVVKNRNQNDQIRTPAKRDPDTGNLIPWADIKYLEAQRGGNAQYNDAINQLDTAISRKLLIPDKIGFSDSPGGSYNLGQIQFDVILSDIRTWHSRLSDALNEQLIRPLIDANFDSKRYPKLHWVGLTEGLTETKAKIIQMLSQAGFVTDKMDWIYEYLGVPIPSKEERKKPKPVAPVQPQGGEQPEGPPNEKQNPFGQKKTPASTIGAPSDSWMTKVVKLRGP